MDVISVYTPKVYFQMHYLLLGTCKDINPEKAHCVLVNLRLLP